MKSFHQYPGDRGSIPRRVIPKTQKMVLDAALLNIPHYKVRVKWSNPGNVVAIEKGPFRSPPTKIANFIINNNNYITSVIYTYQMFEKPMS